VYCVSYERFGSLFPDWTHFIPLEEVFRRLGSSVEAAGPVLEDEGIKVYAYWDHSEERSSRG